MLFLLSVLEQTSINEQLERQVRMLQTKQEQSEATLEAQNDQIRELTNLLQKMSTHSELDLKNDTESVVESTLTQKSTSLLFKFSVHFIHSLQLMSI